MEATVGGQLLGNGELGGTPTTGAGVQRRDGQSNPLQAIGAPLTPNHNNSITRGSRKTNAPGVIFVMHTTIMFWVAVKVIYFVRASTVMIILSQTLCFRQDIQVCLVVRCLHTGGIQKSFNPSRSPSPELNNSQRHQ